MAAGGSSGADVGSPQNAAMVDAGDGIALASGSKPKSAAAGAFASRRSSRQASPARTSLFHTQQLTGGGGSSRSAAVAAASVDPEEQVRKAQERLEAYNRAQKETTRAAEAEEAARRQRHADERNRHNLAKERRRVEIYALNALLALSEAARTQLLVEAMTAQGQGQDAQGLQASGGGADTSSGAAAEGAAGSSGGAADDFDAGLTDDAQDSGSEEEVGPQVSANHSKGIALLRHGV
ncbi:hypothetical protein HXX76_009927 [Chlamydomonas incerta]|uniref:Uncharacterized protein n=1 Tax=Chlamydomonas incerta TaxID=51695 RepID=A0A835VZR8_CHLIN|nr:hypothetical protein HXX76_009927 [Chlamydomonas incerta]|eukprot:KAG2430961.1 hypothetical protein HXX76_009927 [Chlamydomonas incerta]